jgi:hypothetical protein
MQSKRYLLAIGLSLLAASSAGAQVTGGTLWVTQAHMS